MYLYTFSGEHTQSAMLFRIPIATMASLAQTSS